MRSEKQMMELILRFAQEHDSIRAVLVDKDGALGAVPPSSDAGCLMHPPTGKAFDDCCEDAP